MRRRRRRRPARRPGTVLLSDLDRQRVREFRRTAQLPGDLVDSYSHIVGAGYPHGRPADGRSSEAAAERRAGQTTRIRRARAGRSGADREELGRLPWRGLSTKIHRRGGPSPCAVLGVGRGPTALRRTPARARLRRDHGLSWPGAVRSAVTQGADARTSVSIAWTVMSVPSTCSGTCGTARTRSWTWWMVAGSGAADNCGAGDRVRVTSGAARCPARSPGLRWPAALSVPPRLPGSRRGRCGVRCG